MAADENIHCAYLSLGSNIDPEINLPAAVRELGRFGRVSRVSSVWQSPPNGGRDQADYLNAVVLLETRLTAADLKSEALAAVEACLGRVRSTDRNAPRTIDIDIMLFDRERLCVNDRDIPDREIQERAFVAVPLAEIAPDYIHPVTGQTLAEISSGFDLKSSGIHRRMDVILDDG